MVKSQGTERLSWCVIYTHNLFAHAVNQDLMIVRYVVVSRAHLPRKADEPFTERGGDAIGREAWSLSIRFF